MGIDLPIHEPQPQRGLDVLNREIPHSEAIDFVHACDMLTGYIAKERPDIIMFPQRGAGPMEWTTSRLLEQRNLAKPEMVDLPIGTHITPDGSSKRMSGISGQEKLQIIDEVIQELQDRGVYIPGVSKIMLVDEVQKGGTITQAASAIQRSMVSRGDEGSLRVVAFQDSRNNLLGDSRKGSYQQLAANSRVGIKATVIPTALFMVDRDTLLDKILRSAGESDLLSDQFKIENNVPARKLFESLADVYSNPAEAAEELHYLKQHAMAKDLGATLLQELLLEGLTDPRPVKGGREATMAHVFGWWEQYIKNVQQGRSLAS